VVVKSARVQSFEAFSQSWARSTSDPRLFRSFFVQTVNISSPSQSLFNESYEELKWQTYQKAPQICAENVFLYKTETGPMIHRRPSIEESFSIPTVFSSQTSVLNTPPISIEHRLAFPITTIDTQTSISTNRIVFEKMLNTPDVSTDHNLWQFPKSDSNDDVDYFNAFDDEVNCVQMMIEPSSSNEVYTAHSLHDDTTDKVDESTNCSFTAVGDGDSVMRSISHDHDYCNKVDVDFNILSEFLHLPELSGVIESLCSDDNMRAIVESTMMNDEISEDCQFLQPSTSFMDTNVNVPDFLDSLPIPEDSFASCEAESSSFFFDVDQQNAECESPEHDDDCSSSHDDSKYVNRRRKNNSASQLSRLSRKQKAVAVESECQQLITRNEYLKNEVAALEKLRDDLKQKFMVLVTDCVHN
jgi:hypothetical protein